MNKKISELPIMANEIQDEDILAMVDVSDMATKKVGVGILRDTVAPNITITAQIDGTSGTPTVKVNKTGTAREPKYELEFSGLKGEPGEPGAGSEEVDWYGTCDTTASTGTKQVSLLHGETLIAGTKLSVVFANGNSATSAAALSINNLPAVNIALLDGSLPTAYEAQGLWSAREIVNFIYDGTFWRIRQKDTNPIGTIIPFGGTVIPKGYFECDYTQKLQSQYPKLYATFGSSSPYGPASTGYFRLPDLREASPVGAGPSSKSGNHIQSNGLALGEFKDDALQGHSHSVQTYNTSLRDGSGGYYVSSSASAANTVTITSDGSNGAPRTENTTHGKIVGVKYFIKYI